MSQKLRRFVFWIGYDGSKFPEMARGATGFGVMDFLSQVVSESVFGSNRMSNHTLKFSPSSRTDAKVHAVRNAVICQVPLEFANFDETAVIKNEYMKRWENIVETVNPGSLKIRDVHRVSAGFCVRRNVGYRIYTYRLAVAKNWETWESIREEPSLACFSEQHYAWRIPPGFSPEKLEKVGKLFEGEQIMGSFFKHTEREKRKEPIQPNALKYIFHVGIYPGEAYSLENDVYDYYNVKIVAKSFVREQIRRMMSCLVNCAYDRMPVEKVKWLLKNPKSANFFDSGIPVAPPNGLFLTDVVYDPEIFFVTLSCSFFGSVKVKICKNGHSTKGNEDKKIFVGGIAPDVTNEDLSSHFSQYGEVSQAQVKYDRSNGRSRGFAFVEFNTGESCKLALAAREQAIKGKSVEVKPAKSRENKKVFVGGLPSDYNEQELRTHFEQFGKVDDIEWPFDKQTKTRRNFAFIVFEEEESADKASSQTKQTFGVRECDVKKAVPQGKRFNGPNGRVAGGRMFGGRGNQNAGWYAGWGQIGAIPYGGATAWGDWYGAANNYYGGQQHHNNHQNGTSQGNNYSNGGYNQRGNNASNGYEYQQQQQQTQQQQGGRPNGNANGQRFQQQAQPQQF
ncbi:unnamed protein product [Caenorhabditis angaria]|uniref:RRM domain-containing protein n=1 Tax=Caenorhabditis angaria TaxID=860376 RepID=A0A9P1INF1_9PELO|nr:unnamed protein product [Caenorhabditis angaria]